MKHTAPFSHLSPAAKFLWLIFFLILSSLIFALAGLLLGKAWLHTDMASLTNMFSHPENPEIKPFLYVYQALNQIGVFILPPLLFAWLVDKKSMQYLNLNRFPTLLAILLGIAMVYTLLPFINWLTDLNAHISLPESLSGLEQWMKAKEIQADSITKAFLSVNTQNGLWLNLVVVALIPAIGEELLFRGLIQRLLGEWTKNLHWGVWLTAILFSAIHMQFYGFFPRLLLGLILGYLFAFSRSLWLPMLVHFVNNASSVIVFYLNYNGMIQVKMEHFGASPQIWVICLSFLVSLALLMLIKKEALKKAVS
jgi:membrane protease YdiL (CAAX protease family)